MHSKSRYSNGVTRITHRGKTITTTLGSSEYRNFTDSFAKGTVEVGYIPAGYENRPDLISDVFYANPSDWWIIMEANNIDDPFEALAIRDRIIIPVL